MPDEFSESVEYRIKLSGCLFVLIAKENDTECRFEMSDELLYILNDYIYP